ncbi:beta strand repeat-containing protein, partial [Pseudomonas sp. KB_15]|uniref:beta strand repeat-containing protein n=1 Tax=Pseudomonas sp. KB_15 TaxID=3233035 RepID=UPI003F9B2BA2
MASTTTTSGGTVTSFSNTPQAKDDVFTTTENLLGVVYWDVMSNDLGGNAKTLWSLDNADSLSTATKAYAPADLLTQDTARAEATSSDTSLNGAKIWITSDGKVGYDAATFSDAFKAQLQALATGEVLTDSFTYAMRLGNGTLSWATATVQFSGENDGVTISLGAQAGTVTEDAATTASTTDSLTASGTIAFNDVDLSDTHIATFAPALGNATHLGTFVLSSVSEAANAANGSVQWTYNLSNAAAQYLAQGQTVTETYLVTISDGHGSSVTQNVTITITGTNDGPTVAAAELESGAVAEDGTKVASGSFAFGDVDLADHAHVASVNAPSGALGTLVASVSDESTGDAAGSVGWTYTLNNSAAQYLAAGQTKTEMFTVTLTDDFGATVTKAVTITITGSNDAPTVTAAEVESGAVIEDGTTVASGSFAFGDVDLADHAHVASVSAPSGALGTLVATVSDESTGDAAGSVGWTYTLNNSAAQYLAAGQTKTEMFTVTLTDDFGATVTKAVTITITGSNDAPTVTAAEVESGAVAEDGTTVASGSFAFGDVDLADHAHVASVSAPSGALGTLVATVSDESTGDAAGSVGWTYTLNNSAAQYLAAGQTKTEMFTVTLTDDFGATVNKNVTITITGSNDAPVLGFETGNDAGAVQEDIQLSVNGQFSSTDIDHDATATWSIAGSNTGTFGSIAVDNAGQWTYTLANGTDGVASAVQALKAGESHNDVFTVQVSDGLGGVDTQLVTITVTGTNDAPVLYFATGNEAGAVQEDTQLSVSGQFSSADIDHDATATWSINGSPTGTYGSIAVDNAGQWTYSLANGTNGVASAVQALKAGESHNDVFTVQVSDGLGGVDTQLVTITVTGTNDAPVLDFATGNEAGAVQEDIQLSVSGQFSSADIDHDATTSWSINGSPTGTYGSIAVDNAGQWTYTLANGTDGVASAVQALKAGESHNEVFSVQVSDGLGGVDTQLVTVTITGTNDAPVLSFATGNDAGAVQEDIQLSVSGQFSSADIDHDATASWSIAGSNTGTYGSIAVDSNGQWTYTLANGTDGVASAVQALKAGESHNDVFTVQVSDGLGGVDTQLVTVTITGTNDQPTLTIDDTTGTMDEGNGAATLSDSGVLSFADLDSHDTVTVSQTANNDLVWSGGTLGAAQAAALVGGFSVDQVSWHYSSSENLDFLRAGETIRFSYTVVATDDSGAGNATSAPQTVTITLTGTNDQPTLTIDDTTGAMDEGNGTATLSDSGVLSFADLDSHDTVTVSQTANNDLVWSGGTLGSAQAAALVGGFSVDQASWHYSSSENLDFLRAGETIRFSYTVVATDNSGAGNAASALQTVTITITGSNDAPVLSFATGNDAGAVQEDIQLSVSGQFSSADIDHDATATWSINGSSTGTYGSIAVDNAAGQW